MSKLQKSFVLVFSAAAVFLACGVKPTQAQNPLGVAVSGFVAHDVLTQASKAADDAIGQAQAAGSALISQGASQLAVLEQNAGLIIGRNIDKLGKNLSVDEENLLGQVYSLTQQVRQAKDQAYQLKDSAAIDLASMEGSIPFTKVPYFIQRIDGISYVNGDSDYQMHVTAFGITPGQAGSASEITIKNAATAEIISAAVSITHKGEAQITFANSVLAPLFDQKKIVIIPITLTITIIETESLLGVIPRTKKTQITSKIGLSLFPKIAGTITIKAFVPQYAWKLVGTVETVHRREGDGEPDPSLIQSIRVPGGLTNPQKGNQHLENVQWHCFAWWSHRTDVCQYEWYWRMISAPSITEDGTVASWEMKSLGESREFWITADKYLYDYSGDKLFQSSYDILWGQSESFTMPSGYSRYNVEGITITKQVISLTPHQSMGDFITFLGVTAEPDPTVSYQIGTPKI